MDVKYILFEFPALPRICCIFQQRGDNAEYPLAGNISFQVGDNPCKVLQTRQALLSTLRHKGMHSWCECHQVHGDKILDEPQPTPLQALPDDLPKADGAMTSSAGRGLLIKTADCQPLLLAHKSGRYIMALHVGWRANRFNFPGIAVNAFCSRYGIDPPDVMAVRGPSLGPARAEFVNFREEWGSQFEAWFDQVHECMNLWALTRHQLTSAGVSANDIYAIDICTAANPREFFSYRKDRNTGRQASIIWIKDREAVK